MFNPFSLSSYLISYQHEIPDNLYLSYHRTTLQDVPLHWHNYIEIELVLNGTADHIHNGIASTIKKGHISVLRINDYHTIKNCKDFRILNLSIKDTALSENMLTQLNSIQNIIAADLDEDTFKTVLFFFEACIKENYSSKRNNDYIKNLLECILILVLRIIPERSRPARKHQNDQLNNAVNYLHNHFRENPNLNTVAEIAHYFPTHFSHVFHKKIGRSYNDYLNELKVAYAKQLLLTTNLKVIDVGYQSGFNSYNNFYSTFKHYTNFSPAEYKKRKATNINSTGFSWRFGLRFTDINTDPAYVFIDTNVLEGQTEYSFSYCYSYDYVIDAFSVENIENNKPIPIVDKSSVDLKDKKRSNIVTFKFKTDNKACYRITLIMGKGLNNVNCEYNYVNLNNLTLYKIGNESENLAQDFTYANGNVSWSENAAVYDRHIDA